MSGSKSTTICGCPVTAFQKMISGKYKLRIMWDLKDGPLRYGEIRSGLLRGAEGTQEIAPRVLSRELKALTHTGLIDRKDYGVVPPKVEYRLTRKGKVSFPSFRPFASGALATCVKPVMARKSIKSLPSSGDDAPAPARKVQSRTGSRNMTPAGSGR